MTDEQMDARLRAAGERWRAATDVVEADEAPVPNEIPTTAQRSARRRWPLLASAAVIAAALVVGGTLFLRSSPDAPRPSGDLAGLQGHTWLLTGVPGTRSSAVLYIDRNGQLVADDECRLIGAHAEVHGSTLTVTDTVTRYKNCVDQYGPGFYNGADKVIEGSSTFRITSDALTISKDGHDLRFVPAPQNIPVPTVDFPTLVGVRWELTRATNASGTVVPVAPGQTLRIDPGKISGSIGCRRFGTTARLTGDQLTIGKYFVPSTACADSPARAVLSGTVRVGVVGAQLTVVKGAAKLVYRWLPADTSANDPSKFLGHTWYLAADGGTGLPRGTSLNLSASGVRSPGLRACGFEYGRVDVQPGTLLAIVTRRPAGVCISSDPFVHVWEGGWQTWSIQDGDLVLYRSGSQSDALIFSPGAPAPAPADQLDGTWNFVIPGASMAVSEVVTFDRGTITLQHRCYSTRGDVAIGANTLTVTNVHPYRNIPCPQEPPALDRSERTFDQRLDRLFSSTATWSISNRILSVSASGVPLMTFEHG